MLRDPSTATEPFYAVVPGWATIPVLVVATLATIIASEATRENLRTLGAARLKDQLASTPGQIAALEAQLAKATDAAAQARLKDEIAQLEDIAIPDIIA